VKTEITTLFDKLEELETNFEEGEIRDMKDYHNQKRKLEVQIAAK